MKSLDDSKLLPGDIILSTQDHYVSKAIMAATKSDISHAMIYVATCSVIDSTGEGVHARNTQRMFFEAGCAVHIRRLAVGLGSEQRERIIRYARSRIGTRYSKQEAARSRFGTTRSPTQQQFCSRLVAQAYAHAGIRLVDSPDYCTPDDIKNSRSLIAVADVVIAVSDEHVACVERDFDTNDVIREATNKVLNAARTKCATIENFDDIDTYLVANPAEDECFAKFYEESGYLTAWALELEKSRWQYDLPLLVCAPGTLHDKRAYCVQVLEDHGDMLMRRNGNRVGYTILHGEHGLETFAKLKALYEHLVDLQFARRAVALLWLQRYSPEALPGPANADSLAPHTQEWFAVLMRQNLQQSEMTRMFVEIRGSSEVCTFCGDDPARDYRFAGESIQPDTVLTCKMCEDCPGIRRIQFAEEYSLSVP